MPFDEARRIIENQAGAGMKATDPGFGDEDEDKWGELTIGDKSEKSVSCSRLMPRKS